MQAPQKSKLIQTAGELKVLPDVARRVLDIVSQEQISAATLGRVVEKDQTTTALVLKITNSSFYGLRNEVRTLSHAIAVLGFNPVKNLVVALSTKSLHKRSGITEKLMWEYSVGAAVAAKLVARGRGREVEEIAFLGGLLHDVGKVFMNNETPSAFTQVMTKVYNDGDESTQAGEQVFGYSHSEVGSSVVGKWGLPSILVDLIELHHLTHRRPEEMGDRVLPRATAIVNLSDGICRHLGIGYRLPDMDLSLQELPSTKFLTLTPDDLVQLVRHTKLVYDKERAMFN